MDGFVSGLKQLMKQKYNIKITVQAYDDISILKFYFPFPDLGINALRTNTNGEGKIQSPVVYKQVCHTSKVWHTCFIRQKAELILF
jgi:hypothetical protein